jgi:hypothetical protein
VESGKNFPEVSENSNGFLLTQYFRTTKLGALVGTFPDLLFSNIYE